MNDDAQTAGAYRVPTYRAPSGTAFFHFLHGHVPRHQIDFIYRPEIPQGELSQQHFSHLSRLMKYIEPQVHNPFAFAIGNLSRDDTQHEPGYGGVGLIFSMRVSGVTDHAGRKDPTFAHAAALIARHLNEEALFEALTSFYSHLFGRSEDQSASALMYRNYVKLALSDEPAVLRLLQMYVREFDDLPKPGKSSMRARWLSNEAAQPKRVVIVHPDRIRFRHIARCASRIASMLYASNIRWSSVTNGREADLENGITVRLVSEAEAGAYTSNALVLGLADVPAKEEEVAVKIFGAKPADRSSQAAPALGWRARYEAERGVVAGAGAESGSGSGEEPQEPAAVMPDSGSRRDQQVMREALRSSHAELMEGREARDVKEVKEEAVASDRAERARAIPPVVPVEEKKEAKGEKQEPGKGSRAALWLGLLVILVGVAGAVLFWMGGAGDGGGREGSGNPGRREKALQASAVPVEANSGAPKPRETAPVEQQKTANPEPLLPEPLLEEDEPEPIATGKRPGGPKGKKPIGGGTPAAETPAAPALVEPQSKPPATVVTAKPTSTEKPASTGVLGGELKI